MSSIGGLNCRARFLYTSSTLISGRCSFSASRPTWYWCSRALYSWRSQWARQTFKNGKLLQLCLEFFHSIFQKDFGAGSKYQTPLSPQEQQEQHFPSLPRNVPVELFPLQLPPLTETKNCPSQHPLLEPKKAHFDQFFTLFLQKKTTRRGVCLRCLDGYVCDIKRVLKRTLLNVTF